MPAGELRVGISDRAKLVELLLGVHADAPTPPPPRCHRRHRRGRSDTAMNDEPAPGDEPAVPPRPPFLVTKEYRRFAEFADACRRDRYVGIYYGRPGSGRPCRPATTPAGTTPRTASRSSA